MLTERDVDIARRVIMGLESDRQFSPFLRVERWCDRFTKANKDGILLDSAPLNVPLMVVSQSLDTLYLPRLDRGEAAYQGSVIVKTSPTTIACLSVYFFTVLHSGGTRPQQQGTLEFIKGKTMGRVKLLKDVVVPN